MNPVGLPMADAPRSRRAVWQLGANAVVLAWLVLAVVLGAFGDRVDDPAWALTHVLLLGAAMSAILIWSEHFAETLLHLPPPRRIESAARLALFQVFVITLIVAHLTAYDDLALAGGLGACAVVLWHGLMLAVRAHAARSGRLALFGRHGYVVSFYIVASAWFVVGATAGSLLAGERVASAWDDRLHASHVEIMLLGVMLTTIVGTLFTLWPTMLGTQLTDTTRADARLTLWLTSAGLAVSVGGLLLEQRAMAGLGIFGIAAGLVPAVRSFGLEARRRPPVTAVTVTTAVAGLWLLVGLVGDAVLLLRSDPPAAAADSLSWVINPLGLGFVVQVLVSSLTFLLPVVRGGGPTAVRAAIRHLTLGWQIRAVAFNSGVVILMLERPWAHLTGSALVGLSVAAFLVLAVRLVLAGRRGRVRVQTNPTKDTERGAR